jgi:hypothetical protein
MDYAPYMEQRYIGEIKRDNTVTNCRVEAWVTRRLSPAVLAQVSFVVCCVAVGEGFLIPPHKGILSSGVMQNTQLQKTTCLCLSFANWVIRNV